MDSQSEVQPVVTLNNGVKMPQIGLGTYTMATEGDRAAFKAAIMEVGYRHIDTAAFFKNLETIGEILLECFEEGLKREELFITTKIFCTDFEEPEASLGKALASLGLDYVDQYLVHVPINMYDEDKQQHRRVPMHRLWAKLEKLYDQGRTRSIGVSNFNVQLTLDLLSYARVRPAVNQIELHPYLP